MKRSSIVYPIPYITDHIEWITQMKSLIQFKKVSNEFIGRTNDSRSSSGNFTFVLPEKYVLLVRRNSPIWRRVS